MLLNWSDEDQGCVKELMDIHESKMQIEKFERICKGSGMRIQQRTLWFINPNYQCKFGLTPRKNYQIICKMPYIRNFFTTSCFYLMKKA